MATKKTKTTKKQPLKSSKKIPIVGIGASAGGLEAFGAFFDAMPEGCGMAFVVVAHLDPCHSSLLPELIQKKTKMNVLQVSDNLLVEANHVYIIPPNKEMAISNGKLQLLDMRNKHGLNLPINVFFSSLAQDQMHNAIAIILSGTGSDGTLGVQSIKAEGGMVMVQEEKSAKYDGMPRNAIATGVIDFVLPVEKMPEQLLAYVKHDNKNLQDAAINAIDETILNSLQKIFFLLRNATEHDFSLYKKNTLCRRIERRMHIHQITDINDYVRYLQDSEAEISILFKELLIGVTNFFRDPDAFDLLKNNYLPALLKDKADDYQVRIWVPGCSSGEEVYSIAIIVQECMIDLNRHFSVQIFGTDIDEEAISLARTGLYPQTIEAEVSPERCKKFFTKQEDHYQIKKGIREMVVFAPQDVIKDPPFTKLDLLCCRNLLIYFNSELQKKLLPVFHYSLKTDGLLFLGSSESIGQASELFDSVDKKWKIFQRSSTEKSPQTGFNFTTARSVAPIAEKVEIKALKNAEEINSLNLLKTIISHSDMSTRLIIDNKANIIYIHGKTGQFIEHAEGTINTNIIEMARPGLKAGLINGINKIKNSKEVVINNLQVNHSGTVIKFNLIIRPLTDFQLGHHDLLMVIFEEISSAHKKSQPKSSSVIKQEKHEELSKLEDELQYTKENLQSTIEELETSNEEMKSTNEELQSTNEELQSTNEELETSKEELQSLNEESATVNAELQSRIDELVNAKDDIKNLLDATDIASIFLDIDLGIRRFTPKATEIFPLTLTDIGRPITHFSSKLKHINLHQYAEKVLQDLSMQEVEVEVEEGKTFRMRVRPYRTTNNVIDGVVITFEDITKIKQIESELKTVSNRFEEKLNIMSHIFMDSSDAIIIEDMNGKIINANNTAIKTYGWSREQLIGKEIKMLYREENHTKINEMLQKYKKNKKANHNCKSERIHKSGKTIPVILSYTLIKDSKNQLCAIASSASNCQIE